MAHHDVVTRCRLFAKSCLRCGSVRQGSPGELGCTPSASWVIPPAPSSTRLIVHPPPPARNTRQAGLPRGPGPCFQIKSMHLSFYGVAFLCQHFRKLLKFKPSNFRNFRKLRKFRPSNFRNFRKFRKKVIFDGNRAIPISVISVISVKR